MSVRTVLDENGYLVPVGYGEPHYMTPEISTPAIDKQNELSMNENGYAIIEDNSRQNIQGVAYERIDCSTTHTVKIASNFQPTICQSKYSGFQNGNERAESWKRNFVILLIILIVLVVAFTVTVTLTLQKVKNEPLPQSLNTTFIMQIHTTTPVVPKTTAESVAPELKPCVGVIYDKKCYWKEVHENRDTTVNEASKICTDNNSKLADIYSEEHYNMLMNYTRADGDVMVWTGMSKRFENPKAILSDGRTAPFTKPRSDVSQWNTAESRRTHVYLLVKPAVSLTDQGMGAIWPIYDFHGALCQSL